MPWYRVEIPESDVAADSAAALMEKIGAEGGHVYYFSPGASKLAPELLREFDATACAEEPDLSHFRKVNI